MSKTSRHASRSMWVVSAPLRLLTVCCAHAVEGGGTAKAALAASIVGERARLSHLLGDTSPSSPADLDVAAGACVPCCCPWLGNVLTAAVICLLAVHHNVFVRGALPPAPCNSDLVP